MAIRIKHRVWVHAYEDTAGKNKLFAPDADLSEVVSDGFDQQVSGSFSVGDGSNQNLDLGDIAAVKGVWLKVNGAAKVTLNGGDQLQMRVEPDATTGDFAKLFIEADISSVNIANDTGSTLTGVYCAWGDPTP